MERKRLFFDIETSPNLVLSWRTGYKLTIPHDNIVHERAIICISYKWEGANEVHSLTWNKKQDDKKMLTEFAKVLNQSDEAVGHNGDRFDIKWFNTRCLYHRIEIDTSIKSIDTLKIAKSKFLFNSNRLDYISKFLGFEGKMDTGGFELWKSIVLDKCEDSLKKMVAYCEVDVMTLEQVYDELSKYHQSKTHFGVLNGGEKFSCPECGSVHVVVNKTRVTTKGTVKMHMKCRSCSKYFNISNKSYMELLKYRMINNIKDKRY